MQPNPTTGSPVDYSWNGYWRAVAKRNGDGWTAEIEIEVRSLQFSSGQATWGLNVSRYVPRAQLTLAWSGISLNAQATDLQREGKLSGTSNLEQGSRFEFDPYGLVRYDDGRRASANAGFDIKYNLTPQLAGLFTYRPDFSDAPANLLNVTVSPYAQSVPENAALLPRRHQHLHLQPQPGTVLHSVLHNINDHWRVGTLLTHGDPTGLLDNSLISFDSTWSTSSFAGDKNLSVATWAARSSGQASPGSPQGYGVDTAYPNDLWWMDFSYNDYGAALDPAMGFLQRPGTRQTYVDASSTWCGIAASL